METFRFLVEALMQLNYYDLLVIFTACLFLFQLSSKVAIDHENHNATSSPLYLVALLGLFSSIFTGAESLYRLTRLAERQLEEEKVAYGR